MHLLALEHKRLTSTGSVFTGAGFIGAVLVGTDGVNDPTVAIYDALDATNATTRIFPSISYDAGDLGLNGAMLPFLLNITTGVYVTIAGAGSCEVIVYYKTDKTVGMVVF